MMADSETRPLPILATERITNLDTVRGLATLGILAMNAVSFGLPDPAYFNLAAGGSETWLDWVIGVTGEIIFDQKMMGLFSLLFGAGTVIFVERAKEKGHHPVLLSLWRNVILLGVAVLHSLLWVGDILGVYAVCAPFVLLLRNLRPRTLLIVGTIAVLVPVVLAVVLQQAQPASGEGLGGYWFVEDDTVPGGLASQGGGLVLAYLYSDIFLRAFGMMLLGVALYRLGIVQGTRSAAFYRTLARVGLGVGLPLAAAGVVWQAGANFSPAVVFIGEVPNGLATIPCVLGYLGLISLWNRRAPSRGHELIRAVGRMALTNYLTQTLLGIFVLRVLLERGELGRAGIVVFVVIVWVLQVIVSSAWLSRCRFGPVEWLWRSVTYRRIQPLLRRKTSVLEDASST